MWQRLFRLDPKAGQTLQAQLRQTLVEAILDGRVPRDVALPSSRELARALGVARNTVVLACQHLADEHYLVPRERSGYFVNPEILDGRVAPPADAVGQDADDDGAPETVVDLLAQRDIERAHDRQRFDHGPSATRSCSPRARRTRST